MEYIIIIACICILIFIWGFLISKSRNSQIETKPKQVKKLITKSTKSPSLDLPPLPIVVNKAEAPFKPKRYLPITKKVIVQECKLSPADFSSTFITQKNINRGFIECIQEQLDLITKDYRSKNLTPIYLMCTKKDLASYLEVTTTKLNKYFKGEGDNLNSQIEQLLIYDDKWNISRLILPS